MPNSTVAGDDEDVSPFLTPREAARLAGVSVHTLARWERLGRLQAAKTLGGQRRYHRAAIIALTKPTPA